MITGRLVGSAGPTAAPVPGAGAYVENVTALRALVGSVELPSVVLVQYDGATPYRGGGVFTWRTDSREDDGRIRFNAGGLGTSGVGWQRVNDVVEGGPPLLRWAGIRTVRVLGSNVTLNGFRVAGAALDYSGPNLQFDAETYTYDDGLNGIGMPTMDATYLKTWVAAFAVESAGQATLAWQPFLRVESWIGGVATYDVREGAMTPSAFVGTPCLICHENGEVSWRVVTITANTANTVTLSDPTLTLTAGDYILPAPAGHSVYRYLGSLLLDWSDGVAGDCEWRNFATSGRQLNSYTGNPFGDLTSLTYQELDFRGYISPLATGVLGNVQVFRLATDGNGCYAYFGHDSADHVIASVGRDRTSAWGDGLSAPMSCVFSQGQKLWAKVDDAASVGRLTIYGWIEETGGANFLHSDGTWPTAWVSLHGTGSPEGVVVATPGVLYHRTDGGAGTTLYVKESGTGDTGWVAYGAPSADEILSGDGPPDGVVDGTRGTLYVDTGTLADAGEATLWVAEQASGNTGWVPCNGDWDHREPANTPNSVAGWNEDGVATVLPLPGYVTLPAHTSEAATSTLVTTTTGAGQLIASTALPTDFRGSYRVELTAAGTGDYGYKKWWFECYVHNEGAATAVVDSGPTDIMAAAESGTTVGAATLAVAASSGAVELSVTPANTNSVRWSAIVRLLGVIE